MTIYYHPHFKHNYRQLDPQIKAKAEIQEALFRKNAFDIHLDTHPLHGKLKKQWSFSVDNRYRILFEFSNKQKTEVIFLDIDTHDIYR